MKADFWDQAFAHYNLPGASDQLISGTESSLNVKLPHVYKEVMRVQNGGCSTYTKFLPPGSDKEISAEDTYWLGAVAFHKLEELEPLTEPDQAGWDIHAEKLELLIAFKQSGACFWCFDYRECGSAGEPSIVYIDAECEIETVAAPNCEWLFDHLIKEVD